MIVVVGTLMIVYVLVGGMKGTTYVQIIKAVLLLVGAAVMAAWVLGVSGSTSRELLGAPPNAARTARRSSSPDCSTQDDPSRLHLAGARAGAGHRGPAAHPHALLHRAERRRGPPVGGVGDLAGRRVLPVHAGARVRRGGAAASGDDRRAANQNNAAPLLAYQLGGEVLLGVVSAIAFATILAVVAGLTITASASFAHDVYANVIRRRARVAAGRGAGGAADRGGRRRRRDRRRHRGERAERRVPGRAGVRRGGVGEPADDPVLAVLGAVQHHRRAVQHLRRPGHLRRADRVLAGGVGQAGQTR